MKTIKMIEFGTVLANRKEARKLFNECEKLNFDVIFDFEGVKLMNSSFADELFAKAIILGKKFKIKNIDDFSKKNDNIYRRIEEKTSKLRIGIILEYINL